LAIIAVVVALLGIRRFYMVYSKHKVKPSSHSCWPRVVLRRDGQPVHGWPGSRSFGAVAWFDAHIVDGAVNGVGLWCGARPSASERCSSGNVRNYAAAIGVGVVLLLVWFVVVRGSR
jgi:NADH-quinone oxidoreductase subunit L